MSRPPIRRAAPEPRNQSRAAGAPAPASAAATPAQYYNPDTGGPSLAERLAAGKAVRHRAAGVRSGGDFHARVTLEKLAKVKQVRGQGMTFGIEFRLPIAPLIALACYRKGLVTAIADEHTLFFAPPLILDRRLAKQGATTLRSACGLKS